MNFQQIETIAKHTSSNTVGYSKAVDHKRLKFILDQLYLHIPSSGKVLDVGCGNGLMSMAIGQKGYQILGVDISEKALQKAKRNNTLSRVNFKAISADDLVADGNTYDAVICSEVLEHLDDPNSLLRTLYQLLSVRGVLIITVPNGCGPRELLITKPMQHLQRNGGFLLTAAEAFKKKLGYTGTTEQSDADDLTHVQFFTKKSLSKMLEAQNFRMVAFDKANFLADVFPFSMLANRSYRMQKLDCQLADTLPHYCTCGFYSAWIKNSQ